MSVFSQITLEAVAELIFYRPHPRLSQGSRVSHPDPELLTENFSKLGYHKWVGRITTYDDVYEALCALNDRDPKAVRRAIHWVCDPRRYLDEPKYYQRLVGFLNRRLKFDGYQLRKEGEFYRLRPLERESIAISVLQSRLGSGDYQSVQAELERALAAVDSDPADAITAACSMVESVCKSILDQMGKPYPSRQEISRLSSEIAKYLYLSPAGDDINNDMKQMLSGLASIATGIGALRTHAGDAHGRGLTSILIEPIVARLAINAAATLTAFYIEAWNRQRPK